MGSGNEKSSNEIQKQYEEVWDLGITRFLKLRREIRARPARPEEEGQLWLSFFEFYRSKILRSLLDQIGVDKDTMLLDIGCGMTVFSQIYEARDCPKVTAVDIAPNIIEHQREAFPHIEYKWGDAQDLELQGKWEVVHAGEVAEHLYFPLRAIDRWCTYVADGGYIVITTPTPTMKIPGNQHVSFVSDGDLRRIMRANGIRMIRTQGLIPFFPFVAKQILKIQSVMLRNKIYDWYAYLPYNHPIWASQAFYIGKKI